MFRVALKSILARKRRLLTTGLAIVLSVAFISGTLVITALINSTLDDLIGSSLKGVDAVVRSTQVQEGFGGQPFRDTIPDSTLALLADSHGKGLVKGVRAAEGTVTGYATLLDTKGERIQETFGPPTLAYNWTTDEKLRGGRLAPGGRAPQAPDEAVIDLRTAKDFGYTIRKPDAPADSTEGTIQAQLGGGLQRFKIVGFGGIPVDGKKELVSSARILLLETNTARTLLKKTSGWDYIAVSAEPGVSQAEVTATISSILPPQHQAITGKAFIDETEASISKIIALFTSPIIAFGFISVFTGIFVIYNTFSIVVAQRTRELALLRAVGASRRQILSSVLLEAFVVGLVASALGVISGWGLALLMKAVMAKAFALPGGTPPLTTSAVVVAVIVGVFSTMLSAIIPAVRATTIAPVAALGEVAFDRSNMSMSRRIFGTLFVLGGIALVGLNLNGWLGMGIVGIGIGAAMLFISVAVVGPVYAGPMSRVLGRPVEAFRGISGRIAKENAGRNPKRTATTAAALSIGVGLVTVVAVFAASIRGATQSQVSDQLAHIDLLVDSGTGLTGLSSDASDYLQKQPLVERTSRIRFSPITVLDSAEAHDLQKEKGKVDKNGLVGESQFMVGLDSNVFNMVRFDGLSPKIDHLGDSDVMVLSKTAKQNKWKVGDTIHVSFGSSTGEQQFKVRATFGARVGNGGEFITSADSITKNAIATFQVDQQIYVQLKPGVDRGAAKATLKAGLKQVSPTAGINTVSDFLQTRLAIVDSIVNLIYVLLGLSVIVALVGVGNTISLSIFERTRELGLLRAVGMTQSQMRTSVRWESAIISLAGTVIGLAIGLSLGVSFIVALDEQGVVPVVPVPTVVVIGVLGALAGIGTALRPARRAARTDVLQAISSV